VKKGSHFASLVLVFVIYLAAPYLLCLSSFLSDT
jgi:hypothetical protein